MVTAVQPVLAQAARMDDLHALEDAARQWRWGRIGSGGVGDTCPLCHAGYVFGRIETMRHPDLAQFCYSCQRRIEDLCSQIASGLTIFFGQTVEVFDVLTRFFGVVAPFSPMARTYGTPYS